MRRLSGLLPKDRWILRASFMSSSISSTDSKVSFFSFLCTAKFHLKFNNADILQAKGIIPSSKRRRSDPDREQDVSKKSRLESLAPQRMKSETESSPETLERLKALEASDILTSWNWYKPFPLCRLKGNRSTTKSMNWEARKATPPRRKSKRYHSSLRQGRWLIWRRMTKRCANFHLLLGLSYSSIDISQDLLMSCTCAIGGRNVCIPFTIWTYFAIWTSRASLMRCLISMLESNHDLYDLSFDNAHAAQLRRLVCFYLDVDMLRPWGPRKLFVALANYGDARYRQARHVRRVWWHSHTLRDWAGARLINAPSKEAFGKKHLPMERHDQIEFDFWVQAFKEVP